MRADLNSFCDEFHSIDFYYIYILFFVIYLDTKNFFLSFCNFGTTSFCFRYQSYKLSAYFKILSMPVKIDFFQRNQTSSNAFVVETKNCS